jgi:hypothetical protein
MIFFMSFIYLLIFYKLFEVAKSTLLKKLMVNTKQSEVDRSNVVTFSSTISIGWVYRLASNGWTVVSVQGST